MGICKCISRAFSPTISVFTFGIRLRGQFIAVWRQQCDQMLRVKSRPILASVAQKLPNMLTLWATVEILSICPKSEPPLTLMVT